VTKQEKRTGENSGGTRERPAERCGEILRRSLHDLQFPVVGIGASAGGLEACTALLKALPVNPGMALVVVQRLDPHHESILHKLLSKTTEMPVLQVEDGMVAGTGSCLRGPSEPRYGRPREDAAAPVPPADRRQTLAD
jgi:chemotaxis response regulator CheB